jgi:hypothetical protein
MASALHEYIDTKSAFARQTVGDVARALLSQRHQCLLVATDKFFGNPVILTCTNCPLTSMCGKLPGEKIRSLTRVEARSIAESKVAAGIAGLGTTEVGTEILAGVSR